MNISRINAKVFLTMSNSEYHPLVSVAVPCYNHSKYVVETLDSIINQTYKNIELIIVDDFSSDNSVAVIENWISEHNIECKFIKHKRNIGVSESLNEIFEEISGQYLSILASDDVMLPDKIERQVAAFSNLDESFAIVYGDFSTIDPEGNIIDESILEKDNAKDNFVSGYQFERIMNKLFFYSQSALFRVSSIDAIQFRFSKLIISEDWYMQLRLGQKFNIYGLPGVTVKYRVLPTSIYRQNWNDEKIHLVLQSDYHMFYSLLAWEGKDSSNYTLIENKIGPLLIEMYLHRKYQSRDWGFVNKEKYFKKVIQNKRLRRATNESINGNYRRSYSYFRDAMWVSPIRTFSFKFLSTFLRAFFYMPIRRRMLP